MESYNYKRIYHPSLGSFVYEHKGSGLIVDNIFKPTKKIMNTVLKPIAKKALKSGIESAGDKLGKKVVEKIVEKSGHLLMKDLQSSGEQFLKKKTNKQKEEDYNVILNRLISGSGMKKQNKKKVSHR